MSDFVTPNRADRGTDTTRSFETNVRELDADAYHADTIDPGRPSLSASIAHLLCTSSPRHAWTQHPRLNPDFVREEKAEFDLGTVAHAALLQPDRTVVHIVDAADWRTKAAQEERDNARAQGWIPLLPHQALRVTAMVAAARDQLAAAQCTPALFVDGAPERTLVWEDEGVLCRARLDYLHLDLTAVDDYKTTSASAEPATWSRRTMYGIGADVQVAFYLRGLDVLYPELRGRIAWRYVVQETFPPYALSVVEVGEDVRTFGMDKVERALAIWRGCLERDEWPAYPTEAFRAELPAWVESQWMERSAA